VAQRWALWFQCKIVLSKTHLITIRLSSKTKLSFKKTISEQSDGSSNNQEKSLMDRSQIVWWKSVCYILSILARDFSADECWSGDVKFAFAFIKDCPSRWIFAKIKSFWTVGVFESTDGNCRLFYYDFWSRSIIDLEPRLASPWEP